MELGIDRFLFSGVNAPSGQGTNPVPDLLEEIVLADRLGIDVFGIGEHHGVEFADSAPPVLLASAAALTTRIRLTSAITILGIADPVRLFEEFATLDLVSNGRAEIVAGRGAYAKAFALFGHDLGQYDELFAEKLDLLLRLRTGEPVHWSGRHRPPLNGEVIYPRPIQRELPVWVGATDTPKSFARAGSLGLPLALGVIGGDFDRLRPLVEVYREAGRRAGYAPDRLAVAVHAVGYIADHPAQARREFFPSYHAVFGELARKGGWPELTFERFVATTGPGAALVVGDPDEVASKLMHVDETLDGVARVCLQMTVGPLQRDKRLHTIELLATEVRARMGKVLS